MSRVRIMLCIFHNINRINIAFTHLINQVRKECRLLLLFFLFFFIFGNFFKIVTLTLSWVHITWMLKFTPHLSFYFSQFLIFHYDIARWLAWIYKFGHSCIFFIFGILFNCANSVSVCGNIKDKVNSWPAFFFAVCWFSLFWPYFDTVKQVKFTISRHFLENTWEGWPAIWHVDKLLINWLRSIGFPHIDETDKFGVSRDFL